MGKRSRRLCWTLTLLSFAVPLRGQQVPTAPTETVREFSIPVQEQRRLPVAEASRPPAQAIVGVLSALAPEQQVNLGPLSAFERRELSTQDTSATRKIKIGIIRQINPSVEVRGLSRDVLRGAQARTVGRGKVEIAAGGPLTWTTRISSPGASSIRVLILPVRLPGGTRIFITDGARQTHGPYTPGDVPIWTHSVFASVVYVQVQVPASAAIQPSSFVLPSITHSEGDPERLNEPVVDGAAAAAAARVSCDLRGFCRPATAPSPGSDQALLETASAGVAHIRFVEGGGHYICSGGLLRDSRMSNTPFFLTAHHCFNSQASARSLETYWRYRRTCGGPVPPLASLPRTRGSTVLATSQRTDFTLVQLSEQPPEGSHFFRWTSEDISRTTTRLYRVHHPSGFSQHYQISTNRPSGGACSALPHGSFLYSNQVDGGTAGGSSGSLVFRARGNEPEVVGQLYGSCTSSTSPCGYANVDGAFARTYQFGNVRDYLGGELPTEPGTGPTVTFLEPADDAAFPGGSMVQIQTQITDPDGVSSASMYWEFTRRNLTCPGTNNEDWWCRREGNAFTWTILLGDSIAERRYQVTAVDARGSSTTTAARRLRVVARAEGEIVFVSNRDGHREIYKMNADGSDVRRLTTGTVENYSPSWSSNGDYIVFISERDGNPEIYMMDADGGNQRRIGAAPSSESEPAWRPRSSTTSRSTRTQ